MSFLLLFIVIVFSGICVYFIRTKWVIKNVSGEHAKSSPKREVASFPIKGIYYRSTIEQERCKQLKIGEYLRMIPEPTNRYDSHAIRIETMDGVHVGYVPREKALKWFHCFDDFSNCTVRNISNQQEPIQIEVAVYREEKEWRTIVRRLTSEDVKLKYRHSSSEICQALDLEQMNPAECLKAWSQLLEKKPNDIFVEYHYLMALGYAHRAKEAADYTHGFIKRHHLEEWEDLVEYELHWRKHMP